MGALLQSTGSTGIFKRLNSGRYVAHIHYRLPYGREVDKQKTFDTFDEALAQRNQWLIEKAERIRVPSVARGKYATTTDPTKLCTDNCKDCKYAKWLDTMRTVPYCDYYLMMEKRRPCKPGDGCTVKQKREANHNQLYRKYYADSFHHTAEDKWRKARVDKKLDNITE